jgi:hypothetical protein
VSGGDEEPGKSVPVAGGQKRRRHSTPASRTDPGRAGGRRRQDLAGRWPPSYAWETIARIEAEIEAGKK